MKKEQLCEIKELIKQFKELWDKSFKTKVYDSLKLEALAFKIVEYANAPNFDASFFTQEENNYILYAKIEVSTHSKTKVIVIN